MKIAIANDMPLAVEALKQAILKDDRCQIIWIAKTGREAVDHCQEQLPDLLLMDLMMPEMDGLEATHCIMEATPCPILIVTSSIEDHASQVFQAMGAGALDAVNTPMISGTGNGQEALLAKINMIRLLNMHQQKVSVSEGNNRRSSFSSIRHLIGIGCSSGGPQALSVLLSSLPADLAVPVVVIQHVDKKFVGELAKWLSTVTILPVNLAKSGELPLPGNIYLANTNDHLIINERCVFEYVTEPADMPYRPSVDVFFHSLARNVGAGVIGVVLTGMGADGAQGLLSLKSMGAMTISQDRESSAVYGMPKAAAEYGASSEILPLSDIGLRLIELVALKGGRNND